MPLLAVTVVGSERPGIIAEVTGLLAGAGVNLEDSSMTLLRGHFAWMIVCSAKQAAGEVESALVPVTAGGHLLVSVREIEPEPDPEQHGKGLRRQRARGRSARDRVRRDRRARAGRVQRHRPDDPAGDAVRRRRRGGRADWCRYRCARVPPCRGRGEASASESPCARRTRTSCELGGLERARPRGDGPRIACASRATRRVVHARGAGRPGRPGDRAAHRRPGRDDAGLAGGARPGGSPRWARR